eukprot:scaffold219909_cov21-Tisochrysis_lutea.AAC.1
MHLGVQMPGRCSSSTALLLQHEYPVHFTGSATLYNASGCAGTWHAWLIKYCSCFGFKPMAVEGSNSTLSDMPHMLVCTDAWHARLVKYYSYFGFKPVAIVGGNSPLSDIPHMLVWGGVGTRMDADIPGMLAKWTPAFRSKRERLREGEHLAAS